MRQFVRAMVLLVATSSFFAGMSSVGAEQYSGTSYNLNASFGASTGDLGSSESYKLESTSGESIVGNAAGGSYKIRQGYISDTAPMLRLSVDLSGLVASYPLDEPSGGYAYDYTSYRAYGTDINGPTQGSGKIGSALTFNGSSQVVYIGAQTQTKLSSTGTLEAWVKSSTSGATMAAVAKANNFWLGIDNGKPAMYDWTGSTMCSDTASITNGSWHHIAVTLDSGVTNGSTLYVDGVQKKTCTWTPAAQTGIVSLGAADNGGSYTQYFNGSIDHVKIFNRQLSGSEIAAEYAAQNSGTQTGLTLGQIIAGTSNSVDIAAIIATNSNDYTLSINQDHDLQQSSYTIPAISALVTSPAAWVEGTTKGLGFTLLSAPNLDGKWGSGANYAAFPGSPTTFFSRSGVSLGASDTVSMRVRADTAVTQAVGDYSNTVTITGTTLP